MKDYATSTVMVAPSPSDTGTSLTVQTGHGNRFPDAPFKVSIYPQNQMPTLDNAEKVLVTAKNGDTFTLERAKSPTTAKYIQAGDIISNSLFAEDIIDSAYNVWLSEGNSGSKADFLESLKGDKGDKGDMGVGVPTGGLANQVLTKNSPSDYDFAWETPEGAGDMLKAVYDPDQKVKPVAFQDETTAALATMKAALTKADVGLSNVDNTSDANKPISTATQAALDGKASVASVNAKENSANKSTSTSLGTSNTLFPTQNAVKTYVDSKVSQDWWEELGAANLTGSSVTVPITSQKKFMKVIVSGVPNVPSVDQLRVRANNAAFNVFVINLSTNYTSGNASAADYYWNGTALTGQAFLVETSVATGSGRAKFNTIAASADGVVRHSSAEMTTTETITSFTAWYPSGATFGGGRMVVLGHD